MGRSTTFFFLFVFIKSFKILGEKKQTKKQRGLQFGCQIQ